MEETNQSNKQIQNKLFDENEYLWIQYMMFFEHRIRILIVKCAVEIIMINKKENRGITKETISSMLSNCCSQNFQIVLKRLEKITDYIKLPYYIRKKQIIKIGQEGYPVPIFLNLSMVLYSLFKDV